MHDRIEPTSAGIDAQSEPLAGALRFIRKRAGERDQTGDWPAEELAALADSDVMRWSIPAELGGRDLSSLDLNLGYEAIAAASVSAALIVSQRDSAAGLVAGGDNPALRAELAQLAENRFFATIGIAQLTTSRQGAAPALLATPAGDGFTLDGIIPWSTGAAHAHWIVAGAALATGEQILFVLHPDQPGITVEPPAPLVSLRATWTTQITCRDVRIPPRQLLRGPAAGVLRTGRKGLVLGQTFLAMGLCRSGLDLIAAHKSASAEKAFSRLDEQLLTLRRKILDLSQPGQESDATAANPRLRGGINDLALRITHTAITLYKGTALLATHPAQRLAREAMFLLVWSCPNPVIDCTVDLLSAGR
jgi:alkylation response protein AidB-like acyl-CoA dehydrogenase